MRAHMHERDRRSFVDENSKAQNEDDLDHQALQPDAAPERFPLIGREAQRIGGAYWMPPCVHSALMPRLIPKFGIGAEIAIEDSP